MKKPVISAEPHIPQPSVFIAISDDFKIDLHARLAQQNVTVESLVIVNIEPVSDATQPPVPETSTSGIGASCNRSVNNLSEF